MSTIKAIKTWGGKSRCLPLHKELLDLLEIDVYVRLTIQGTTLTIEPVSTEDYLKETRPTNKKSED
ncbi:MAG: hypothetical protein A2Z35_06155 [Actinobacteria bacterium RBG_19FT_COMBO_36_27]|nr:MAG: hypothetical protein A2Z35_06155 [Actinobacteria bacterium RBG_19FT_COMBO_36_27]